MLISVRSRNSLQAIVLACMVGTAVHAEDQVERGRYLVHAGGCVTCHTAEDAGEHDRLAGGRSLVTPFGVFHSPNITPDPKTGIGRWSDADFIRAFREGLSPGGRHYYPAFPYPAYTGITDADLLAIKTYLFSLKPVARSSPPHDLPWYLSWRWTLGVWKRLHFEPGPFRPDPEQSASWNRGAYLVRHLGHCGECHTPRTWSGGLDPARSLAGNPHGPDDQGAPNITPSRDSGIGAWSVSDLDYFLETGMLPDGDFVGGAMGPVIDDNTARLTAEDRAAMADYLQSQPALPSAAAEGP